MSKTGIADERVIQKGVWPQMNPRRTSTVTSKEMTKKNSLVEEFFQPVFEYLLIWFQSFPINPQEQPVKYFCYLNLILIMISCQGDWGWNIRALEIRTLLNHVGHWTLDLGSGILDCNNSKPETRDPKLKSPPKGALKPTPLDWLSNVQNVYARGTWRTIRGLPRAKRNPPKIFGGFLCVEWCRRRDSNSHGLSPTTPSRWRVYQFHHFGEDWLLF